MALNIMQNRKNNVQLKEQEEGEIIMIFCDGGFKATYHLY